MLKVLFSILMLIIILGVLLIRKKPDIEVMWFIATLEFYLGVRLICESIDRKK